jgi:hypothetical protein
MTVPQILAEIALLEAQLQALYPSQMTPTEQKLFNEALQNVGVHLTLNNAVPTEVGCAEAVSKLLSLCEISDGLTGIAGTAALYEWLLTCGKFTKVTLPEQGAIIVSPTGSGNNSVEGHTGVFGRFNVEYKNDWTIYSNNSATGNLGYQWCYERWLAYYHLAGGLSVNIFRAI